jgi:hypothetical protein
VDLAQVFIFVAGWIFFAAWGLALVVVSVVAFGRDILAAANLPPLENYTAVIAAKHSA